MKLKTSIDKKTKVSSKITPKQASKTAANISKRLKDKITKKTEIGF